MHDYDIKIKGEICITQLCPWAKSRRENRVDNGIYLGSSSSHARIPLHKKPSQVQDGWPAWEGPRLKIIQTKNWAGTYKYD